MITVLEGDALSTLESLDGPIDFVLLDGWKDLYLPVIKLLEPRLSTGSAGRRRQHRDAPT